jgi:hypothetical protein
VTRQELLKLFEEAADDAMRGQSVPEVLRTEKTVKLNGGNEQSRAKQNRY